VIGGFAILNYDSHEAAIEGAKRVMKIHADAGVTDLEIEIRPMVPARLRRPSAFRRAGRCSGARHRSRPRSRPRRARPRCRSCLHGEVVRHQQSIEPDRAANHLAHLLSPKLSPARPDRSRQAQYGRSSPSAAGRQSRVGLRGHSSASSHHLRQIRIPGIVRIVRVG
jgi:hypothetical protein